jgi:hypothetical protein
LAVDRVRKPELAAILIYKSLSPRHSIANPAFNREKRRRKIRTSTLASSAKEFQPEIERCAAIFSPRTRNG